ncbi:MAG: AAA family ATPase [Caldisericaceae bacterium]
MKPETLTLKGFLSYRQKETLDFSKFHIALVSGDNGNGKSSLLDGITFALYSMARGVEGNKRGLQDIVSNGDTRLSVELTFEQNENIYRIVRTYDKVKSTSNVILEIQREGNFINISENSLRETDEKIRSILRMDYDTFLTSSFIMQGKSDYFTSKNPTEKIEILRQMLMLDIYENAREIAREEIKEINIETKNLSQRLEEIKVKIQEKEDLSLKMQNIATALNAENKELTALKDKAETINQKLLEKKSLTEKINNSNVNINRLSKELSGIRAQIGERAKEREDLLNILQSQEEIKKGFSQLLEVKNKLSELIEKSLEVEKMRRERDNLQAILEKEISSRTQEYDQNERHLKELETELRQLNSAKVAQEKDLQAAQSERQLVDTKQQEISNEIDSLKTKLEEMRTKISIIPSLEARLKEIESIKKERENSLKEEEKSLKEKIKNIEEQIKKTDFEKIEAAFKELDSSLNTAFEKMTKSKELSNKKMLTEKDVETLSNSINELKEKVDLLNSERIGHCPLCGAELTQEHKKSLLNDFDKEIIEKQGRLSILREKIAQISEELDKYKIFNEDKYSNIKKLRDAANAKLEKTREELASLNKNKKELNDKLNDIETKLNNLLSLDEQKEIKDIHKRLEEFQPTIQSVEEFEKRELALNEQFKKSEADSKEISEKIISFKAKLSSLTENISSREQAIQKIAERNLTIEKELKDPSFMKDVKMRIAELARGIEEGGVNEDELKKTRNLKEELSPYEKKYDKLKEANVKITEIERFLDENKNKSEEIVSEIANEKKQLENFKDSINSLEGIEEEYNAIKNEIKIKEESARKINEEKVRLEEKMKEIEKIEKQSKDINNNLIEDEEKRHILEICSDMFGKEGIPIAIIRSILPQIESFSNDLLLRMTDGRMQVKFQTIKDSKTGEKSTLQIDVYDNGQRRRYELFSGGEQFRINLAIRIGISLFLSAAANAPLETLVIDEGFGSQDESGKESILYEINSIKDKFKKVLIITHVGDIKENFPYEIRVIKDENGSHLTVF